MQPVAFWKDGMNITQFSSNLLTELIANFKALHLL